jgi:cobalt transporter subunit CbtA
MVFRRIVISALLVGALSGFLLTAVQSWQVIPIIKSAEVFEGGAESTAQPAIAHDHAGQPAAAHTHDHAKSGEGASEDDFQRTAYTLLANVLTAIGLALVLLTAIVTSLRANAATRLDWRHGLLWGAAGYAVFFLAPSLGLPPEIPGAAAAPLEARQFWWLFAVTCTAGGLAGAAFGKSPWRWAALALLVVPHVVGAPPPPTAMFADQPAEAAAELTRLAGEFIGASALANGALWLALGLSSIWAMRRFVMPSLQPAGNEEK